jgi:hypothetical protein
MLPERLSMSALRGSVWRVVLGCGIVIAVWGGLHKNSFGASLAMGEQSPSTPVDPTAGTELSSEAKKARFDLCIDMLKEYYDAIEARFAGTMTFMVVVLGWLITSDSARSALRANRWLRLSAITALTLLLLLYAWNIAHWTGRWHEIRGYAENLNYMEPRYWSRYYELPALSWYTYMIPVALLYALAIVCVEMIAVGRFAASSPPR